MCEKLLVENQGGPHCRNFAKQEFWKVEHVKLLLVKHFHFWDVILLQKKRYFSFTEVLSLISFLKNPEAF